MVLKRIKSEQFRYHQFAKEQRNIFRNSELLKAIPYTIREQIISDCWHDFYKTNFNPLPVKICTGMKFKIVTEKSVILLNAVPIDNWLHINDKYSNIIIAFDDNLNPINVVHRVHRDFLNHMLSAKECNFYGHILSENEFNYKEYMAEYLGSFNVSHVTFDDILRTALKKTEITFNDVKPSYESIYQKYKLLFEVQHLAHVWQDDNEQKERMKQRNKLVENELIEITWKPERFFNYCLNNIEKESIINRCNFFKIMC